MAAEEIENLERRLDELQNLLKNANGAGQNQNQQQIDNNRYQSVIPLPKPIEMHGDVAASIKYFKSSWENYKVASGLSRCSEAEQIAVLLCAIGEECFKQYENFPLSADDKSTSSKLLSAMEKCIVPKRNKKYERAMFNMMTQDVAETIDQYVNRLKNAVKTCGYECSECRHDLSEEFVLDRLCISIQNVKLRERLYEDNGLGLQDAINKIKIAEMTEKQLKQLEPEDKNADVNRISTRYDNCRNNSTRRNANRYATKQTSSRDDSAGSTDRKPSKQTGRQQQSRPNDSSCYFCGGDRHDNRKKCPAYGEKCRKCKKFNHFATVCQNKVLVSEKRVKSINVHSDDSSDEEIVFTMKSSTDDERIVTATLDFMVNDDVKRINCQLDTAATCNVIGYDNYCELVGRSNPNLCSSQTRIRTFGNHHVVPKGQAKLSVIRSGHVYSLTFEVVPQTHPPLLSCSSCKKLKLVTICKTLTCDDNIRIATALIDQFSDVFTGIGKIADKVSLEIDTSVKPVIQKPRFVPIALRGKLRELIADLEKQDIISKVDVHTEWVSNVVLVNRANKLRICIDPVDLNKALKRVNYQMPTMEEILPELKNAKVFTTLDANKGFWQMALDNESSLLTTFWTPYGRYKWNRVPFGISPAPELYQRVQHEIIEGLEGVECICDDLLIYGCGDTHEEAMSDHNKKLKKLLIRLRGKNLKLNKDKIKLCQTEVDFFGHLLTNEGIKPDSLKLAAIINMPSPKNVKEVQTFIGMVTYLSKFVPNLSAVSEPIRRVSHNNCQFEWKGEQRESFKNVKKLVSAITKLQYYDSNKPIKTMLKSRRRHWPYSLVVYDSRSLSLDARLRCKVIISLYKQYSEIRCYRLQTVTKNVAGVTTIQFNTDVCTGLKNVSCRCTVQTSS